MFVVDADAAIVVDADAAIGVDADVDIVVDADVVVGGVLIYSGCCCSSSASSSCCNVGVLVVVGAVIAVGVGVLTEQGTVRARCCATIAR